MSLNSNTKKPFCQACHYAGKPESEYTSHWIKSLPDRIGHVTLTCPYLLNNPCPYCKDEDTHMASWSHAYRMMWLIPILKEQEEQRARMIALREEKQKARLAARREKKKEQKKVSSVVSKPTSGLQESS